VMDLHQKKILLIAPSFFNYDLEIRNKLRSYGAIVDLYDDKPSTKVLIKALIRIYRKSITFYTARYFKRIIYDNKHKNYDVVFFVKGETLTRQILSEVKSAYPKAKFVLYLWDSIRNYKELRLNLPLFDRTLTFDIDDSLEIKSLIFRPLFYLDDYRECATDFKRKEIDLLFIGTVHSDRWVFLKDIKKQAEKHKLHVYYYPFIQSPIVFIVRKIFDPRLRSLPLKEVRFKPISKEKVIELIKKTEVVIDIQHPKQTGLTMRTIEMIGARKKLITSNPTIADYDFYSKNNVAIIDRKTPKIDPDFWSNGFVDLPDEIYNKYSIDGWIKDVFHTL
jgi:hypothetical protein